MSFKYVLLSLALFTLNIYSSSNFNTGHAMFIPVSGRHAAHFQSGFIPFQVPTGIRDSTLILDTPFKIKNHFTQDIFKSIQLTRTVISDFESCNSAFSVHDLKKMVMVLTTDGDAIKSYYSQNFQSFIPIPESQIETAKYLKELDKQIQDTLPKIKAVYESERIKLDTEIAHYDEYLGTIKPIQQIIEVTRINASMETEGMDYIVAQKELEIYCGQIKTHQENIALYESGSFKSQVILLAKQAVFYSPANAIAELKEDICPLIHEAKKCRVRIGTAQRNLEKLQMKKTLCRDRLCRNVQLAVADFKDVDNSTLYKLDDELSKLREILCNEGQRLGEQLKNTDSTSDMHAILHQNIYGTTAVYKTCKNARASVREEIGSRLYTPEYIASLTDSREELMDRLTSDGQLSNDDQAFLEAINIALKKPQHIRAIDPQLDHSALSWLNTHGVKQSQFTHFVGDPVGLYMFRKNLETITLAKDLETAHPAINTARECANAVVKFGSAALDMVQAGFAKDARILTDTARAVYDVADFSVNVAHGALEGTVEGYHALADICVHPVETVQRVYSAVVKIDEFWMRLCQLDPSAINDVEATSAAIVQASKDFLQLPLNEKGHYIGRAAGFIWGPGTFVKGAKCLAALPKVQEGVVAISRMAAVEMDVLSMFAQKTATGAMLAAKVNGANLVNLGGKLMTQELADALVLAHKNIGSKLPMRDFISLLNNVTMPVTKSFGRAFKPLARAYSKNLFNPNGLSHLKIPQGLTQEQFAKVTQLIKDNEKIKKIGGQVFVQGSRAKETATIISDIDIGIRVDQQTFDLLIKECFGTPNPGSDAADTMLHAIETGKIQYGEIKTEGARIGKMFKKQIREALGGMRVDLSIIRSNGSFDIGPFINL